MYNSGNRKFDSKIFVGAASIIGFILWLVIDNTYDNGDSITHYAIAHYSWKHPQLLFDNWGKPVFTILSSPFAQLGWKGITFFNTLTGVITCCLVAQIIHQLKWSISPYCALLLFFIPNFPLALNSGLTEPLYALLLTATVYLIVIERYHWAAVAISFLPFVRSEGFISMTVVAVFLLALNKWKNVLLMLTGLACISVLGFIFQYESIFWVFTTNPYTANHGFDNYGSGNWGDFFSKFYYMTGIPFTILFWGATLLLMKILVSRLVDNFKEGLNTIEFLLLGSFFSFFLAHVVFWKFGLFHSFGMSRVLISIVPIGLLMVLYLLNQLLEKFDKAKIVTVFCIVCLVMFPFTSNKSAWKFSKEFVEDPETAAMKKIPEDIKIDTMKADVIYYSSIPLMTLWGCDVFDETKYKRIGALKHQGEPEGRYAVVTEDWFMNVDCNIKKDDPLFKNLRQEYSKRVSENNVVRIYMSK
ncbi:hypothetical protein [Cytophaga aurantiaca]|uniref:hypothetical protein n=1 Tax=Cytophaga aurantiaca TaxID=29530 RepID=UPI000363CF33|nr:hypothetical protein [Cytophaga aurantiaca]